MNDDGAKRVAKLKKKGFKLTYIKEAGHQMIMENPNELTENMIDFCKEVSVYV